MSQGQAFHFSSSSKNNTNKIITSLKGINDYPFSHQIVFDTIEEKLYKGNVMNEKHQEQSV